MSSKQPGYYSYAKNITPTSTNSTPQGFTYSSLGLKTYSKQSSPFMPPKTLFPDSNYKSTNNEGSILNSKFFLLIFKSKSENLLLLSNLLFLNFTRARFENFDR